MATDINLCDLLFIIISQHILPLVVLMFDFLQYILTVNSLHFKSRILGEIQKIGDRNSL